MKRQLLLLLFFGAALILAAFSPALQGEFLHWDDRPLFVENPHYKGFSPDHLQWMSTTYMLGHWQPLSWLSYAADFAVWKLNAGGWHLTSLLLHLINAGLVYRLCCSVCAPGRFHDGAALTAALFWALHPLRVEPVVWISTRGYLLCTTFCLLSAFFYLRTSEQRRYPLAALLFFLLAGMTKGIGMMFPPVLLLMDVFILRRIRSVRTAWSCLVEKIPFFAVSLLTGIMAFKAKQIAGGMVSVEKYGFLDRFGQALYGVWFYLGKIIMPVNLSALYTRRPDATGLVLALMLTALSVAVLILFRRKLFPIIGTLGAFLLLIFPMLGITQSGIQMAADRFTYLASVPFSVLLALALLQIKVMRRTIFCVLEVLVFLFGVQTASFSATWSNDLALWCWAVSVDPDESYAYNSIGQVLMDKNLPQAALKFFDQAILTNPKDVLAQHNYALALARLGQYEQASKKWEYALSMPNNMGKERDKVILAYGWCLQKIGDFKGANEIYAEVIDDKFSAYQAEAIWLRQRLLKNEKGLR